MSPSYSEFEREVIESLTELKIGQREFNKWVEQHKIESAAGFARLDALETSVDRVKGGMWVVGTLGVGTILAWIKAKLGL